MEYKYLRAKNNFEFYTLEHVKPVMPVKPVPTKKDFESESAFVQFAAKMLEYFDAVRPPFDFDQKVKIYQNMKAGRHLLFKEDLEKEAGITNWPNDIKDEVMNLIWTKFYKEGYAVVVEKYLEYVNTIKLVIKFI